MTSYHFSFLFTSQCCSYKWYGNLCYITRSVSPLINPLTRALDFVVIGHCLIIICDFTFPKVFHVKLLKAFIRFFYMPNRRIQFESQSCRCLIRLNVSLVYCVLVKSYCIKWREKNDIQIRPMEKKLIFRKCSNNLIIVEISLIIIIYILILHRSLLVARFFTNFLFVETTKVFYLERSDIYYDMYI